MVRFGLTATIGCCLPFLAKAQEPVHPALFDAFVEIDAQLLDATQVEAARIAFGALVREASTCGRGRQASHDRARCVVDTLFASGQILTVAEPGGPESSTVTSALVSHRGNCAALTALALALAERVHAPMEAVVFPRHVVVRDRGNTRAVFELLNRGATLSMSQLRTRLGTDGARETRVRPTAFPAFYLDNLAVRFADAGDGDRAEAMFEKAVEAGPRLARIRFNYGTFLLGKNRLVSAKDQLQRAVRLDSSNGSAWANLGVALARLGEIAEARHCFDRTLRHDPGNTIAAENLKALKAGSPPRP